MKKKTSSKEPLRRKICNLDVSYGIRQEIHKTFISRHQYFPCSDFFAGLRKCLPAAGQMVDLFNARFSFSIMASARVWLFCFLVLFLFATNFSYLAVRFDSWMVKHSRFFCIQYSQKILD